MELKSSLEVRTSAALALQSYETNHYFVHKRSEHRQIHGRWVYASYWWHHLPGNVQEGLCPGNQLPGHFFESDFWIPTLNDPAQEAQCNYLQQRVEDLDWPGPGFCGMGGIGKK